MESWKFTISHIAAFVAGIVLTGYLFRTLWMKVSVPSPTQSMQGPLRIALLIVIYFIALVAGFGFWLDREDPGDFPFVEVTLAAGIAAVLLLAWCWMKRGIIPSNMKWKVKRTKT